MSLCVSQSSLKRAGEWAQSAVSPASWLIVELKGGAGGVAMEMAGGVVEQSKDEVGVCGMEVVCRQQLYEYQL